MFVSKTICRTILDDERNDRVCSIENGCSHVVCGKKSPACDVETQAGPRFETSNEVPKHIPAIDDCLGCQMGLPSLLPPSD